MASAFSRSRSCFLVSGLGRLSERCAAVSLAPGAPLDWSACTGPGATALSPTPTASTAVPARRRWRDCFTGTCLSIRDGSRVEPWWGVGHGVARDTRGTLPEFGRRIKTFPHGRQDGGTEPPPPTLCGGPPPH